MKGKWIIFFFGFVAIGLLLAACGAPPTPKVNDAAGTAIVATFMAQITQTAAAAGTPTLSATESAPADDETEEPDIFDQLETSEAPDDPALTPTPDASLALLNRFRFVTVSAGNLYVRNGTGVPKQITQSGKDHDPIISPDGQKIVFYRDKNIFVINADGNNAKVLVNSEILPISATYGVGFLRFVGNRTVFFRNIKGMCGSSVCQNMESFVVNIDTGKIVELSKDAKDQIQVSANGEYFFVVDNQAGSGRIDVYTLDGEVVHSNLFPSAETFWTFYWLSDSSGLIAFAAKSSHDPYTIWRYRLKDNLVQKFTLQPALMSDAICRTSSGNPDSNGIIPNGSASPDGNWMLYADSNQKMYLANLQNGQSEPSLWDGDCSSVKGSALQWSPDSQHFASRTSIGSVDNTPAIKFDGRFIAWLDNSHYLFSKGKEIIDLQTYIAEVGKESVATQVDFLWSPVYVVLEPTLVP